MKQQLETIRLEALQALDAVADAVSMAFAMCAGAVAMLLISVILCMKSAGG